MEKNQGNAPWSIALILWYDLRGPKAAAHCAALAFGLKW